MTGAEETEAQGQEEQDNSAENEIIAKAMGFQTGAVVTEEEGQTETGATGEQDDDFAYELEDGTRFKTQAEALKHQQKLLRDAEMAAAVAQAQADAYRQNNFQQPVVQQQQAPDLAQWETEFYADPNKALEAKMATLKQQIFAEQQSKEADERVWRNFTEDHPELSAFRKEVTDIIMAEGELFGTIARTRGEKAARDLAATKMKQKLDSYYEAKKPRRDLGQGKSVTPATTQTSVTRKTVTEKPMSMTEQMSKLNEKRKR